MAPEFIGRLDPSDAGLLIKHASYYGCLSLVCEHEEHLHPFVFATRRKYGLPPGGVQCRCSAGIPGKMAKFRQGFWKGPVRLRAGDLAYTEIPMFGAMFGVN